MAENNPKSLEDILKKASEETPPPFHMQRTLNAAKQNASRREKMRKRYLTPIAGTVFVVALVAAMLFIPVTYKIHVGSLVTIEWGPDGNNDVATILGDLQKLDNAVNVNYQANSEKQLVFVAFEDIKASKAVAQVNQLLENQDTIDGFDISSRNITKEVGGNALAAITGGKIIVNAQGMTDDEMEAHLMEQLSVAGYNVSYVNVETDENGEKRMEFSFEVDSETTVDVDTEETEIEIHY